MEAILKGSFYSVTAEVEDVRDLASKWPCSNLDTDAAYRTPF